MSAQERIEQWLRDEGWEKAEERDNWDVYRREPEPDFKNMPIAEVQAYLEEHQLDAGRVVEAARQALEAARRAAPVTVEGEVRGE